MQKPKRKHVILATIIAALALSIIAAAAWWNMQQSNEAKQRAAAEAAAERQKEAQQQAGAKYVAVEALNIRFEQPGGVTIADPQGGEFPYVTLLSDELKEADYSCEGENTGSFGRLELTNTKGFGPQPTQYRMIGEDVFGFVSSLTKNCYEPALINKYRVDIPKKITETIERTEDSGGDT